MATKKKTRRKLRGVVYGRPGSGKTFHVQSDYAELLAPSLKSIYFGGAFAEVDVPTIHTVSKLHARSLKLRKAGVESINSMLATAYRAGHQAGSDKAKAVAREASQGSLRANERQMRKQQAAVAEAVKVLADVLRNNEVYGGTDGSGVLTISD